MVKKVILLAGVGLGYLLGSRAGRQSYESIKAQAQKLWNDPKIQEKVTEGTGWAKEKAPMLQEKVSEGAAWAKEKAPLIQEKVTGHSTSSTNGSPASDATTGMTPAEPQPAAASEDTNK